MSVIVGVDIAKSKFDYRIITEGNENLSKGSCKMTYEGFQEFIANPNISTRTMFVMESTGLYHIPLLSFLNKKGFDAYCVNPLLIKKQVMADSLRKTKTDSADALSIAKYGRQHYDSLKEQKSRMDDEVKAIARRRQQIVEDIARAKTQLKADLAVAWPEILQENVFTDSMLRFLSTYGSAEEVLAATDEELTAALSREGKGKTTSVTIDSLRALSTNSIGVSYRSDMVKDSAEKVIYLNKRESKITETLYAHEMEVHSKEIEILTSIPGIGNKTACQFMAEVGNIKNFSTYQKLIAFIGTDPGIYESGQQHSSGHITKHGNANLRRVCYIMATKCVALNPVLGDYYTKKRGEGFSHRKAMIATSNKMIKIIFTLLTRGETFKLQPPVPQMSQENPSSADKSSVTT